jgi:hypothetical protein
MIRANRRLGLVAAVGIAAILAGCTSSPSSQDVANLRQQAELELTRWADAVAAAGGESAFVPVEDLTIMIGDDWGPAVIGTGKTAMMAGAFETTVSLPADTPPDGQLVWPDGTGKTVRLISAQQALADMKAEGGGSCGGCTPLRISAARLTSGSIETNRGRATVPVWEFSLQDTPVQVARVAIADRVTVTPLAGDSSGTLAIAIDSATGTAGDRKLTVRFTGAPGTADQACGADYDAQAVESSTAVVVIVLEHRNGLPAACSAVGAWRTADVELAAPLGDRTVLEARGGMPVSVEPPG